MSMSRHPIVDAIAQINFGDTTFIPLSWYEHIRYTTKRGTYTDPLACCLLAEIVNPCWDKNPFGEIIGWHQAIAVMPFISNVNEWADLLGATPKQIRASIKVLVNSGMVDHCSNIDTETAKKIICSKKPQNFPSSKTKTCSWCQCSTLVLHEHHFPIFKKDGGTDTVLICPNCHHEFHCLIGAALYQFTPKTITSCLESISKLEVL